MFGALIQIIKKNKLMPKISDTEKAALEAGTVWVEGELFSGRPNFEKILAESYPSLTDEEKAFLDGPCEEVCNMASAWDINEKRDITPEMWDFLKEHRFFGLIVPKEFGGKGFSQLAFSAVIGKLGTHSYALNTVVLIPNSIGPSELLMHYGTKEQKEKWLPRLSAGEEIPAFALTEPNAGSDAASMTSHGVVFKDDDGELKIRLNWSKRYITLAPIATLLGLAFKLEDPDNLLGKGENPGITCALVPTDLPGVEHGKRHDPMGTPFPNGPTTGKDVVIPASNIIGGSDWAGKGWRMLMEALSGGRAISLPGGAAAGVKAAARAVGAYAALRQQFGMNIGKFEGIEEPLARIAGNAYLMEAARIFTIGAVETGQKPSVVSAIAKYNMTEIARQVGNDGMDVLGGKAICLGPKNPIAEGYKSAPIAVTVEGANILTRTLIVFGQGALRCHPYLQREVKALEDENPSEFRNALFGHIFHVFRNMLLVMIHGMTRGLLAGGGGVAPQNRKYVRKIKWASAIYALLADMIVAGLGPKLKAKGKLAGRFADALSSMYLATAALRRFEAEGRRKEDQPLLDWAVQSQLYIVQKSIEGIFANFEFPIIGGLIGWFGGLAMRINPIAKAPKDRLGSKVAGTIMVPGEQRDRLTDGIFIPQSMDERMKAFDHALELAARAEPIVKKIKAAIKARTLPRQSIPSLLEKAVEEKVITADEAKQIEELEAARFKVLEVDAFTPEEYFGSVAEVPEVEKSDSSSDETEEKEEDELVAAK